MDRWRGRLLVGLAVVILLTSVAAGAAAMAGEEARRWLVVRDAAGAELARAPLGEPATFRMRYRNSVYRSLAEEVYTVASDSLRLVELRADELAVLEEYSMAFGAVRTTEPGTLAYRVSVERPPIELPLRVRATALGQRTLLVGGTEIELWRLVAGREGTLVILAVEGAG